MRKLGLTVAAALAATVAAAPAYAVSVNFDNGTAVQNNMNVLESFEEYAPGTALPGTNAFVYAVTTPPSTKPSGTASGNFGSVLDGGSYTYNLAVAAPVVSFLIGSLDEFNSVTLTLVGGGTTTQTFSGLGLGGSYGSSGRVTFDTASGSQLISAITFTTVGNPFEFDTISSAAPEPATWAMMILGFGFAGMSLRSSRRGKLALA